MFEGKAFPLTVGCFVIPRQGALFPDEIGRVVSIHQWPGSLISTMIDVRFPEKGQKHPFYTGEKQFYLSKDYLRVVAPPLSPDEFAAASRNLGSRIEAAANRNKERRQNNWKPKTPIISQPMRRAMAQLWEHARKCAPS